MIHPFISVHPHLHFAGHAAHFYFFVRLLHWLRHFSKYAYVGLFLGAFLEGELVLLTAGFLSYLHVMNIGLVIIVAFLGAIAGDNFWFEVGRRGGMQFLKKWGRLFFLTEKRIAKAEDFFRKHGRKTIFASRFVFGTRVGSATLAGTLGMDRKRFIASNALGVFIWAVITALIGFFFGKWFQLMLHVLHDVETALLILAIAALIIVVMRFFVTQKDF